MFGLRSIGAIVGLEMLGTSIGGAIGPLLGGYIFDTTNSYGTAFLISAVGLVLAIVLVFLLKVRKQAPDQQVD